ncbi:hypothetical protein PF008_g1280 [Phytophthora fragariae]|uniref:Uncharacterized protein n=1 Tax=Phytophthora fragariae TaxID=53985 RepID=A0A6G0SMI5_9STRA|nr:hypothetical protein PF008_g1282 [Phytophthora fragariae]KAE9361191.1 hypothetical protein PF008_g1280 [Phytophthora fragariae]
MVMAKVGCTSVSDSPRRFKQLVKGNREYPQVAAGLRIQVEFTAEDRPEYDPPYTLEGNVHKAMADYYMGASFSGSTVKARSATKAHWPRCFCKKR